MTVSPTLARGSVVAGRYVLEEPLKAAPIGESWRANSLDTATSPRSVRINVLRPPYAIAADAFTRRLAAVRAVREAHVVEVSDEGIWQGRPFVVMETHADTRLREYLDEARQPGRLLDLNTVWYFFERIALGLKAAHLAGTPVFHACLTPSSVLLKKKDASRYDVRVCDFGIAEFDTVRTQRLAKVRGLSEYVAPEQALQTSETARTDVFALSVILVELLTLNPMATRPWWQLASEGAVRTTLGALRDDVDKSVWDRLEIAMRADPSERFANAGDFLEALRTAWPANRFEPLTAIARAPIDPNANRPPDGPVFNATKPQPALYPSARSDAFDRIRSAMQSPRPKMEPVEAPPAAVSARAVAPSSDRSQGPISQRLVITAPDLADVSDAASARSDATVPNGKPPRAPSTDTNDEPDTVRGAIPMDDSSTREPALADRDTVAVPSVHRPIPDATPFAGESTKVLPIVAPVSERLSASELAAASDAGEVFPYPKEWQTMPPPTRPAPSDILRGTPRAPVSEASVRSAEPATPGARFTYNALRFLRGTEHHHRVALLAIAAGTVVLTSVTLTLWLASRPAPPPAETTIAPVPHVPPPVDPEFSPAARAARAAAVRPCPDGMVHVDGASFARPSPTGDTGERVRLEAFCVDRTEVSVGQYRACVAAGTCTPDAAAARSRAFSRPALVALSRFCTLADESRTRAPMNCVSWSQASALCASRSARLPTAAEWEYVARGGDARVYPWGMENPAPEVVNGCGTECRTLPAILNVRGSLYGTSDRWLATADVGSIPNGASPLDVLDMSGNVSEWTADVISGSVATNEGNLRVVRGGSWIDTQPAAMRVASRWIYRAEVRLPQVGFRCVAVPRSARAGNP